MAAFFKVWQSMGRLLLIPCIPFFAFSWTYVIAYEETLKSVAPRAPRGTWGRDVKTAVQGVCTIVVGAILSPLLFIGMLFGMAGLLVATPTALFFGLKPQEGRLFQLEGRLLEPFSHYWEW